MFNTFGFWVSIILLFIRFIYYISYLKTGINPIKHYVENEMKKYNYDYDIEEKEPKKPINNDNYLNQNKNNNLETERVIINEIISPNNKKNSDNLEENNNNHSDFTINEPENKRIYTYKRETNSPDDIEEKKRSRRT
jgi:hypothetical protein